MKTSHILLTIIAFVTLTGMVATDVLLRKQYDKINWSDPYQTFERRVLPPVKHLVVDAAPIAEVIVEKSTSAQALLLPRMADSYQTRQQGDTLFVSFTMNYEGELRNPRDNSWYELPAGLVLRLPAVKSLRIINGCLTLRKIATDSLAVSLQNSRLRTHEVVVAGAFELTASRNSFAQLGADRYQSLRAVVQDSSGLQIYNSQIETFLPDVSPKAEVQLRGQALKWLK